MNAKAKGNRNEYKSRDLLEAMGYYVCRAGASLGIFDLIAVSPRDILLIQVKTNRNVPRAELEEIQNFQVPPYCFKVLHRWNDYARKPIVTVVQ